MFTSRAQVITVYLTAWSFTLDTSLKLFLCLSYIQYPAPLLLPKQEMQGNGLKVGPDSPYKKDNTSQEAECISGIQAWFNISKSINVLTIFTD